MSIVLWQIGGLVLGSVLVVLREGSGPPLPPAFPPIVNTSPPTMTELAPFDWSDHG